jgi:uncharacterized protein (TIRG00374 family)
MYLKKRYKFWLGILISGFFFILFIWGIDFREVWKATREANYFFVFLAIIVNIFTFLIRAERWKYLLDPIKRVNFRSLFSAVCIGFMGNSLLPARAGEFIRAYVIGKRENISKTGSFATIVTERLFDGLTLLIMLIVVVSIFPFPTNNSGSYITMDFLRWAIGLTSFFYGVVIVAFILLSWKPRHVWQLMCMTLFRYLPQGFIPKIEELYNAFLTGLECLKRGRHMFAITLYSIVLWVVTAFGIYLLFPAFSLEMNFLSAVLVMVVVAVIIMLPSSPGFVGTFHLASSETLILLAVNPHIAKTFAIVHHACCILPMVCLGLFYLMRENISFREIRTSVSQKNTMFEHKSDDQPKEVSQANETFMP